MNVKNKEYRDMWRGMKQMFIKGCHVSDSDAELSCFLTYMKVPGLVPLLIEQFKDKDPDYVCYFVYEDMYVSKEDFDFLLKYYMPIEAEHLVLVRKEKSKYAIDLLGRLPETIKETEAFIKYENEELSLYELRSIFKERK